LTINPDTGMPEAFSLSGLFSSVLPMFAGAMFPGAGFAMQPLLAGALTGGVIAKVQGKDPLMGGLMGGLGGMSGSNLSFGLGNMTAPSALKSVGPEAFATEGAANMGNIGMANTFNTGAGTALGQAGTYSQAMNPVQYTGAESMMASPVVRNAVQATQQAGGILPNTGSFMDKELTALSNAGRGAGDLITGQPGAFDNFKNAFIDPKTGTGALTNFQAATKIGMPIGGALLGGLEPSDLYGEPMKPSDKDKYDPYATLNLSNDTGLRLLAGGGAIYDNSDNITPANLSRDGFGVGRLNNLAGEQARSQAETYGYAGGGAIAFADGGDPTDKTITDLALPEPTQGIAALPAAQPIEQGPTPDQMAAAATAPSTSGSIIEQVAFKIQQDPNYQPQNPIEAAIVKQLKGANDMGQGAQDQQGLGSLGPSQPMAPSFNPSQAMGPTYFAGMNAPQGYAEGGETSLNLDRLPSLNLNFVTNPITGEQLQNKDIMMAARHGIVTPWAAYGVNPDNYDGYLNKMAAFGGAFKDKMPFSRGFKGVNAAQPTSYALNVNSGQQEAQYAHGGYLDGQGDGMSDSIPATIEGKQPARLADGEFVVPADVVSHLGNGSSKAGSKRLYKMLDKVRHARTGTKKQGREINPNKYMPA